MAEENALFPQQADQKWQRSLRQFKETLAERLWALPSVTEAEKELLFKEYLSDLDSFEKTVQELFEQLSLNFSQHQDENNLLRRLMGVSEDDLKTQVLTLGHDMNATQTRLNETEEELKELRQQNHDLEDENKHLRGQLHSLKEKTEARHVSELERREGDVRFYSETHEKLKLQLADMETRLVNLKTLTSDSNAKLLQEKQQDMALLQKNLLTEMEQALRQKQQLLWKEEDMFAQGVAHRVRTALVSAQGQLYLTMERLGLMRVDNQKPTFFKGRFHLLIKGTDALKSNFDNMNSIVQDVTEALDRYLHLTGRRDIAKEPLDMKALLQERLASLYQDRQPSIQFELLSDDPLPFVAADKSLLQFCVETLLQNAVEALPEQRGEVKIHVRHDRARGELQVRVTDTGTGVPSFIQPRLFEPFLTSKDGRQGLSLNRARRYAELHGGELRLVNTSLEGTTFELGLPLAKG